MLFDLKPKEKLKDFFNYKEELNALISYLTDKNVRMIVLRGLRRTGKSSLLKVALNKTGIKHVIVDARELTSLSRKSFESRLLEEIKSIRDLPSSLLEKVEGIEAGIRISLKHEEDIWKLLKSLNPVIAVDEAQMLRGTGVEAFFAAVFDNTNCKIIITGSEVGIVDYFIGKDEPKAPLFGRAYNEIKTHQLTAEKSKEFLVNGFEEAKKNIPEEFIEQAVSELDGIVGWLTIFGNYALSEDYKPALKKAIASGMKMAYSEFESFLATRPAARGRYLSIIRTLAVNDMRWSDIKRSVEIELKESIADPQFTNYLDSLRDYGFVVSKDNFYSIPDPLLKRALKEGVGK